MSTTEREQRLATMRDLWARLEAQASRTPLPLRLRPPTTEAAIDAAEQTMGLPFPADFRASLLVHDGQVPQDGSLEAFEWLPGHAWLASLDRIVEQWREHCRTFEELHAGEEPEEIEDGKLVHFFWHARRIPIAGNLWWDQDNTYLDFIPGSEGRAGQVAVFGKGNYGEVHGPSFSAILRVYVEALESGEWWFEEGRCRPRSSRIGRWAKYAEKKLGQAW